VKKNRGKYIFLSIIGVLFLVVILNLGKIKFMFNMLKSYNDISSGKYEDSADDSDSLEPIENPLLDIIDEEDNGIASANANDNKKENQSENKVTNNKDDETKDNVNSKSYINIVSNYNNKLELLQKDYEAKLDSITKLAYEEYKSGNTSNAKLANKYLNKGSRLEEECDANFNEMIKKMEKELKDNGHDTSVIKDLKEYYASYKGARRSQLVGKAKNHMN